MSDELATHAVFHYENGTSHRLPVPQWLHLHPTYYGAGFGVALEHAGEHLKSLIYWYRENHLKAARGKVTSFEVVREEQERPSISRVALLIGPESC